MLINKFFFDFRINIFLYNQSQSEIIVVNPFVK